MCKATITQVYENNCDKLLDTTFMFPINDRACFANFEAEVGEKKIKGVVKEKEQAKTEFQERKAKGETVAMSEIVEENKDVMKLSIGNVNPKSTITIRLDWLEELEISLNKFWRFVLYSTITPR